MSTEVLDLQIVVEGGRLFSLPTHEQASSSLKMEGRI